MMTDYKCKTKGLLKPLASVALCSLALAGCSNNDKTTTIPPDPTELAKDTVVEIQVVDASGKAVPEATVELTKITDNTANKNLNDPSDVIPDDQESQVTDEDGVVAYAPIHNSLDDGAKTIQVKASKAGYLPNNIPVTITQNQALNKQIVITQLTKKPAEGISATVVEGQNVETTPLIIKTPSAEGGKSKTSITIPEAPLAYTAPDATGKKTLLSNKINVALAQFDSDELTALDAFPGGLSVSIANPNTLQDAVLNDSEIAAVDSDAFGNSATAADIVFESAGFTAIEVRDDKGNLAKTFDKELTIRTKVNPEVINPKTKSKIDLGDKIPIWSYEASTGKWSYEKVGIVESDGEGGLEVVYTIKHLSYYNLDFHYGERCEANLTFVDSSEKQHPLKGRLKKYVVPGERFNGWSRSFKYPGDDSLTLNNAPAFKVELSLTTLDGKPVTINYINDNPPTAFSLCDEGGSHTVEITPPAVKYSELTASAAAYCSNDSNVADIPVAGSYISIYRKGSRGYYEFVGKAKTQESGEVIFSLPVGEYRVKVRDYYNVNGYRYISKKVTLSEESAGNVALRIPKTCEITTGGSSTGN